MVGVWGVWGPECFGVSQFPRGPAGKLGQEEVVEEKVQESSVRKSFVSAAALERSEAAKRRAKAPRARGTRRTHSSREAATGSATRVEKPLPC